MPARSKAFAPASTGKLDAKSSARPVTDPDASGFPLPGCPLSIQETQQILEVGSAAQGCQVRISGPFGQAGKPRLGCVPEILHRFAIAAQPRGETAHVIPHRGAKPLGPDIVLRVLQKPKRFARFAESARGQGGAGVVTQARLSHLQPFRIQPQRVPIIPLTKLQIGLQKQVALAGWLRIDRRLRRRGTFRGRCRQQDGQAGLSRWSRLQVPKRRLVCVAAD
jgi:hypothetical protein